MIASRASIGLHRLRVYIGRNRVAIGLAPLVLLILWTNPFTQTLAPMDLLLSYPGWDAVQLDPEIVNRERSDAIDHRLANWTFYRESLRSGEFPFWNPQHQSGSVGLQAPIYSGLTIPFWVFALMPDAAFGYTLAIMVNVLIAAYGMFFLSRALFGNNLASVFAAITFAFCGFNVAWAHWPHVTTGAYIPWVLCFTFMFWQTPRIRYLAGLATVLTLLFLGGFPFIVVLCAFSVAIMGTVLFGRDVLAGRRKPSAIVFSAAGLGLTAFAALLIAAPFLSEALSILDKTDISHRRGGTVLRVDDMVKLFGSDMATSDNGGRIEFTFSAGLLPMIFLIIGLPLLFFKRHFAGVFAIMLFAFTATVTYQLVPPTWIRMLPGYDINPWWRSGLLFGVSLAIISAYVLTVMVKSCERRGAYRFAQFGLVVITAYQGVVLAGNFATMNAKPAIASYFPSTPTIDHLVDSLEPGQNIVADSSFLVSGTLGNYGIVEPFAHGFRQQEQKAAFATLSRKFASTSTATSMNCRDMIFDDDSATRLGVKYFIYSESCRYDLTQENSGTGHVPSPSLDERALSGNIIVQDRLMLEGVQFTLATYHAPAAPSDVIFSFQSAGAGEHSVLVSASDIKDNQRVSFMFDEPLEILPGEHRYSLRLSDPSTEGKLSAWSYQETNDGSFSIFGNSENSRVPKYSLLAQRIYPETFSVNQKEPGIIIAENERVTGSAYFMDTSKDNREFNYDLVELQDASCCDFVFSYKGSEEGLLVMAMRLDENWHWEDLSTGASGLVDSGFPSTVPVQAGSVVKVFYDKSRIQMRMLVGLLLGVFCFGIAIIVTRRLVQPSMPFHEYEPDY